MYDSWRILGVLVAAAVVGAAPTQERRITERRAAVQPSAPTHPAARLARERGSLEPASTGGALLASGDLDAVIARGRLRILARHRHRVVRPNAGRDPQETLIRAFAEQHGVRPVWIKLTDPQSLRRALADGLGDLIVGEPRGAHDDPALETTVALYEQIDGETIAWYARRQNTALLAALNGFINQHALAQRPQPLITGDLDDLEARELLRVAARPDGGNWVLGTSGIGGFEYELIREFARRHGMGLKIQVADSDEQMLDWLAHGRVDVIAAQLPETLLTENTDVHATDPYRRVEPVIVAGKDAKPIENLTDLIGEELLLHRDTEQWSYLARLASGGVPLYMKTASESMTTKQLLAAVAAGEADYTVVDRRLDAYLVDGKRGIRVEYPVGGFDKRWLVRARSPQLLAALNAFADGIQGERFYAIAYRKNFTERALNADSALRYALGRGSLSPFDHLVRQSARRYGFDWRLLTAQMYQESRFDPQARSHKGAVGLMQLIPRTARELGVGDLHDPESAIDGGVSYLHKLRERLEPELPIEQRTWFALAAYNAGYARIQRARSVAARRGLDPDRWFGHVEQVVKEKQTVVYLREIRRLYEAYSQVVPQEAIAAVDGYRTPYRFGSGS